MNEKITAREFPGVRAQGKEEGSPAFREYDPSACPQLEIDFANTDKLREQYEREKKADGQRRLKEMTVHDLYSLKTTHQHCKRCPIRLRTIATLRHPFQFAKAIWPQILWKWKRKRMRNGWDKTEKLANGRSRR